MRLVIAAATPQELATLTADNGMPSVKQFPGAEVDVLVTGVGMLAATASLMRSICMNRPDFVLQAGIAGAFDRNLETGSVVAIASEQLADMGAREQGQWKDLFDLGLEKPSQVPFTQGRLPGWPLLPELMALPRLVDAVTVNEITTQQGRIQEILTKYQPSVESMEGAALHYVCTMQSVPFLQIRAISNYVGERDKSKWKIREAIENLGQVSFQLIEKIYTLK